MNSRLAPRWSTVPGPRDEEIPRLRALTSDRQAWQDNEEDATTAVGDPALAGRRFGYRWSQRAGPEQLAVLQADEPRLPRHLDGELLRHAEKLGIETWDDEGAKFAVRAGFWQGVGEPATGDTVTGAGTGTETETETGAETETETETETAGT